MRGNGFKTMDFVVLVAVLLLIKGGKKPPQPNTPPTPTPNPPSGGGLTTGATSTNTGGNTNTGQTFSQQYPWLNTVFTSTPNTTSNSTQSSITSLCTGQSIQVYTSLSTANRCTIATLQYMLNTHCLSQKILVDGIYGNQTKTALQGIGISSDLMTVSLANIKAAGQTSLANTSLGLPTNALERLYFYFLKNL